MRSRACNGSNHVLASREKELPMEMYRYAVIARLEAVIAHHQCEAIKLQRATATKDREAAAFHLQAACDLRKLIDLYQQEPKV